MTGMEMDYSLKILGYTFQVVSTLLKKNRGVKSVLNRLPLVVEMTFLEETNDTDESATISMFRFLLIFFYS